MANGNSNSKINFLLRCMSELVNLVFLYRYGFQNFLNFYGRAGRLEFWCMQVFYFLALVLLVILPPLGASLAAITFPAVIACHIRRLHDVEHSGWFLLPKFIYVPWLLYLLRIMWRDGVDLQTLIFGYEYSLDDFLVVGFIMFAVMYEFILIGNYLTTGHNRPNEYGDPPNNNFYSNF